MPRDVVRFVFPAGILAVGTVVWFGLFVLWAKYPERLNQELALRAGILAALLSGVALTEIIRRAVNPSLLVLSGLIYVLGLLATMAFTFGYALFFSVFHSKDF